ncbi:hypothetical protein [Dyella sp. 20L07]|uniref:hypothetical protein n=1 Tax=Dyella sp. 20L07 TaxID=3384240 RepID=UPI003D2930E3
MTTHGKYLALASMLAFASLGAPMAHAGDSANTAPTSQPSLHISDATWASLFDESKPLSERQSLLAGLERDAGSGDAQELYLLGSLYHMGQHAHGSPAQANPDRASIYFANAAVRGSLLAMAKIAEIKLAAGQYREAMNWAQIYVYYAVRQGHKDTVEASYGAELIRRIDYHVERSEMSSIMKDVTSFVAVNNASIKAGLQNHATHADNQPSTGRHHLDVPPGELGPDAGVTDYLITFRADGTATNVQLIDSVPRVDLADTLRLYASGMVLPPLKSGDGDAPRYAWVPIILGDGRYGVRNKD